MRLILTAPEPAMADAFASCFSGVENVVIHRGPFQSVPDFDCMVSAANGFGLMDGGVDAAITAFYGTQLQTRIQQHIIAKYLGEQPVGTAFVIESGDEAHPWLVHAPTMRVPETIAGTDGVYRATWAALLAVYQHNRECRNNGLPDAKINSLVFPAMGAGCGQVPFHSVAAQMLRAWQSFINPLTNINWQSALLRARQVYQSTL